MQQLLSRSSYYARSVVTLLTGFRAPHRIVAMFLGAQSTTVETRRTGWRFAVRDRFDVWIIKETCIDRDYLRDHSLETGWSVVDVGGGIGDFTVLAASECAQGTVHVYEPDPVALELLRENLRSNDVSNVVTFPEAAGAGPIDLATVLDRLPTGRCDFLKIDCEGCEYDLVLSASGATLRRIARVSMETHEFEAHHRVVHLVEHLERHGFDVRTRPNPVHGYLGFLTANRRDEPDTSS